jgi:cytoskeletal protein RodZ
MDEFEDSELSAALRERAARTRPPLDVGQAFESVRHRARRRRIRNGIVAGIGGAAAVAAIAIGVGAVTSDRDVVRTPATAPPETGAVIPPATSEPATTVDSTSTTYTHSTTTTTGPRRTTTTTTARATAGPAVPAVTETYESVGGSMTVRLAGGRIALVGDPEPAAGFTPHVYDNGPDRVRVRFESATDDAEIRVDLVDGRLIPTIRNPDGDSSSGPGSGSTTTVPDASGDNSGSGSSQDNSGPGSGSDSGSSSGPGSGSSEDNSGPGSG